MLLFRPIRHIPIINLASCGDNFLRLFREQFQKILNYTLKYCRESLNKVELMSVKILSLFNLLCPK
jgi:hypothetical protein